MRVAAVQMTFDPTIQGNLARIAAAVGTARKRGARTVLFPECAVTGYRYDFPSLRRGDLQDALAFLNDLARSHGTNLVVGMPWFAGRRLHNCAIAIDRAGRPVHVYAKNHLTDYDRRFFAPGDDVALFELDGVACTSIICHERRYPELVRLAVMAGARVIFHPTAGLDRKDVSRAKRGGRDGMPARAFENAVFYLFANSVGPQGGGLWSSGDSKIVAPDGTRLGLADNERPAVVVADLDLSLATGKYAREGALRPAFLSAHWRRMIAEVRRRAAGSLERYGMTTL